jgi:hypothetical protein
LIAAKRRLRPASDQLLALITRKTQLDIVILRHEDEPLSACVFGLDAFGTMRIQQ